MRFAAIASLAVGAIFVVSVAATFADDHFETAPPSRGERAFHILNTLPFDAASYQPAAAALVRAGVPEKFGHEEWAAVVLTNEVHQHVGIYSILGAKMGMRAREILEAPPRAVNVTVETGGKPPVSCVIDGLQVALGSTLAQDLIHAPTCEEPRVAAVFEYKARKVRLSLRPEAQRRVAEFIAAAIKDCGNLTPAYFERIEACSYRVWAEFDRNGVFDEEAAGLAMN
jgi:pyrimidine-specific ribonucleoside hydrolase